jgi:diguanylate cyclase (GGDEF)-like protein
MAENRREDLLILKRKIVGYVFIDTTNVINHINESIFELCKSFISLIYLMINNYHLKRISTIDKLTGVNLRKHIEQEFSKELNVARLKNTPLSVIMLDIDKFKSVNDNYGHRKGDEILSHIGDLIKQSIRSSDYVGRYGGEEFIIVLPETDAHDGYSVAEKIRLIIDDRKLLGDEMPLTVSLGIATFPIDGANEEELIEKADQSLYYSKNNGRNKVTSWDEKLIKEGHRYDRLTGILTGNISSDTRNVQAMLDIIKQLNQVEGQNARIMNTFMTLIDITEGDEVSFIKFSDEGEILQTLYKKKGQAHFIEKCVVSDRLINQFKNTSNTACFIDWDEIVAYDESTNIPNWKSYIILSFNDDDAKGMLAISVEIKDKEFDFSNMNFVESLKPILKHILF